MFWHRCAALAPAAKQASPQISASFDAAALLAAGSYFGMIFAISAPPS